MEFKRKTSKILCKVEELRGILRLFEKCRVELNSRIQLLVDGGVVPPECAPELEELLCMPIIDAMIYDVENLEGCLLQFQNGAIPLLECNSNWSDYLSGVKRIGNSIEELEAVLTRVENDALTFAYGKFVAEGWEKVERTLQKWINQKWLSAGHDGDVGRVYEEMLLMAGNMLSELHYETSELSKMMRYIYDREESHLKSWEILVESHDKEVK